MTCALRGKRGKRRGKEKARGEEQSKSRHLLVGHSLSYDHSHSTNVIQVMCMK